MLSKISAHIRSYDGQTKLMYFFIEDDIIRDKVSADIKKNLIASLSAISNF